MMPCLKKAQAAMANSGMGDKPLVHLDAMIGSMTPQERAKPALLNAKRKISVAKGSGTTVQEVTPPLKMPREMNGAIKQTRKLGGMTRLHAMFHKAGRRGHGTSQWRG